MMKAKYTVNIDDFGGSWWPHSIECKTLKEAEAIITRVHFLFGYARKAEIVISYW